MGQNNERSHLAAHGLMFTFLLQSLGAGDSQTLLPDSRRKDGSQLLTVAASFPIFK